MGARATIGLAAVLLVTGRGFDLESLYLPGIALLVLAGGAATWGILAARGASVERFPGPPTVVEGERYPLRAKLRGGVLPPRGELTDPLLERPIPISISGRGGVRVGTSRAGVTLTEAACFTRRGRHRLEPARLVVRDPLGLGARTVESRGGGEVLVLPRIERVVAGGAASGEDGESAGGAGDGAEAGLGGAADVEIDGLRPYRRGSPASRIHWPAVARHGELIERRLASGAEGAAIVVLDAERPVDEEALDRAVRATASLGIHLARIGGCTLLIPGSARPLRIDPQLRGWAQAHARLALVEPGSPAAAPSRAGGGAASFWVTAAPEGAAPRGLSRGSFIVTPFPDRSSRTAFTVAGCHGLPAAASAAAPRRARSAA